MESFAVLFADLILAIRDDDLDKTKEIVATLNEMIQSSEVIESGDFLTSQDIFCLQQSNDSYDYLVNNIVPVDEAAGKDLFNLKIDNLQNRFEQNKITIEDIQAFVDKNIDIPKGCEVRMLRLAILIKDYDLIIKIKSQLEG